ncbi:CAF17-like 4Fe-4S cluster assembly/insertion protein YgfZ [Luteipulveratus flavus]|uniref:Folate-binding protein n=1 Tax=Luteipulveratus flavus TaxID=3031728 RepID=A0ABT6CAK6_9MICO|nr:folate-binding protein [Luteipulveratus sp. YIM 133296]MDF8265558.1 folate-binding protein [Luteipulveratus sp. YIM 133296]
MTDIAEPTAVSPLLSRPGAVAAEGRDAGVAAHYGDPSREQRMLQEGLAVVDLSHRGVVRVTGQDRLTWLDSMTTQQLKDLPPHRSAESLVLSPKGHVEHALHVVDDGTATWLSVEPGTSGELTEWLDRMRFMLRVEVEDVSDRYAVLGEPIGAESTPQELQERGEIAWRDPWPEPGADTAAYSSADPHPAAGRAWRELVVPVERLGERVGDRPPAGLWAAEAERVAAWRPRLGQETDHRTIPHELDWLRTAVHLHKGCYRGQETVARVHNLGRPPRRLAFVHLDGSGHVLPDAGTPVEVAGGGRPVGHLTSVARHREDGPIGLVLLKRNVPVEADLVIGGVAAAQTVVVDP